MVGVALWREGQNTEQEKNEIIQILELQKSNDPSQVFDQTEVWATAGWSMTHYGLPAAGPLTVTVIP